MIFIRLIQILSLTAILCVPSAYADQAAYLSKKTALKAAALIKINDEVRYYCKPCGDMDFRKVYINSNEVVHTGHQEYYEVKLNGKGIDLAYTYIFHDRAWINLAMYLKIKVKDVPEYLPDVIPKSKEQNAQANDEGKLFYITEQMAQKAISIIKLGDEIRFLTWLGDEEVTVEQLTIKSKEIVHAGHQDYYKVKLNGRAIDLANTFIPYDDHWKNLAMHLKIKVNLFLVLESLPDDLSEISYTEAESKIYDLTQTLRQQASLDKSDNNMEELYFEQYYKFKNPEGYKIQKQKKVSYEAGLNSDMYFEFAARYCEVNGINLYYYVRQYVGNSEGYLSPLIRTSDDGLIIVGTKTVEKSDVVGKLKHIGVSKAVVIKMDKFGEVEWEKFFTTKGFSDYEGAVAIETDDDHYVVYILAYVHPAGMSTAWLIKMNDEGSIIWENVIRRGGEHSNPSPHWVKMTPEGDFEMEGHVYEKNGGPSHIWHGRVNKDGNLVLDKVGIKQYFPYEDN